MESVMEILWLITYLENPDSKDILYPSQDSPHLE